MSQSPSEPSASFRTTRWSLVAAAGGRGDAARNAMWELANRYWYPIYAYLRRCGHAADAAQDLARLFFGRWETQPIPLALSAEAGRFRSFLFDALNRFLAATHERDGPRFVAPVATSELEARYLADGALALAPGEAFSRAFARELLVNGLKRLRAEAQQAGRAEMYDALEPYLTAEPTPGELVVHAQKLALRPLALSLAISRLRQRYRELVEHEVGETVGSPEALSEEMRVLQEVLGG